GPSRSRRQRGRVGCRTRGAPAPGRPGKDGAPDTRLLSRRGHGRSPLLAFSAGALQRDGTGAVLVPAWHVRMTPEPPRNTPCKPAYVEFGVQSNFSLLRGGSRPEELVATACLLGYGGMGLADRNTVSGVVRAVSQAHTSRIQHKKNPGKSLCAVLSPYRPGCRRVFCYGMPDMPAYPQDRAGWGHLCRMLTQANLRDETEKGATLLR